MNKEYLEDTLTLLASVILIDKKVYPEEVETFASAVNRLSHLIDPNILFTDSMAKDWFMANRTSIDLRLKHDDGRAMIKGLLHKLSSFKDSKEVFFNMIRIAHADKEYHSSEHELIKEASTVWKIPYDPSPPRVHA